MLLAVCAMAGVLAGAARWCLRAVARTAFAAAYPLDGIWRPRVMSGAGWLAVLLAASCCGFLYAAMRADARIAYELPAALEGRDIDVRGYVKGLPTRDASGVRFLFAVESTEPAAERFPQIVQLTWMAEREPAAQAKASRTLPLLSQPGAQPKAEQAPDGLPQPSSQALPSLTPGERWQLRVRLKRPHGYANFGGRDGEAALFARNIRATGYVSDAASSMRLPGSATGPSIGFDRWRAKVRARIEAVLPDAAHRGIVTALAVGAQDGVSDADWQLMRRTGTSHLVAISGLHIGFVAGLAAWFAGALWRRSCFVGRDWPLRMPAPYVSALAGALFAAIHAGLAGFNVPAQRVLWMLGVVALAFVSGRSVAPSVVLAWALGLVLVVDPWAVLSAGFWLSFCAVAAIAFAMSSASPRVPPASLAANDVDIDVVPYDDRDRDERLPRRASRWTACIAWLRRKGVRIRSRIESGARVQFAVTIALAPLTALWFAQIPLIGPLANAFAIPWVSVSVTPVVLAGVALPAPFDALLFRLAHSLLDLLMSGLRLVSGPAWAVWQLRAPDGWTLAAAALGVIWALAPRGWPLRGAAPFAWLPLLLPPPDTPPAGAFRVTALDIGQGASILVETAQHRLLFDAGPGPESTHAGERVVAPVLRAGGIDALDALIISHADSDHAGGASAVFDGIEVRQLLASLAPGHPLWERATAAHADTVRCAAGQRWQWDGVEFAVLWPQPGPLTGKTNAHCCVLRVRRVGRDGDATHAALITADNEAPEERALVARMRDALRADILLVPHHGSKTSSTEPFLDSVEPRVAVFQVGYRNRFHHPNPGVWARYEARHIELARSDTDGAVRIGEEGAAWSLERYRDTHRRYWMGR